MLDVTLIACFVAILLAGTWFAEAFFTERNLSNLLRQIVANGLISLGMLLVILTGGIDLSVGSVVALGGVLFAGMTDRFGIGPALGIAVACGAARRHGQRGDHRALQAAVLHRHPRDDGHRARLRLSLYRDPHFAGARRLPRPGATLVGPMPLSMIIMLGCYALVWFYLNRTPVGRATVAIGGNEETVRLAGVNVGRTIVLAYVLSGAFSALSGAILVSRLGIAQPSLGIAYELDAIAACVIGGAALGGGSGGVPGTLFGVFTLGLINNLLNLVGVKSFYQDIVKGSVIILAVLLVAKRRTR